MSMGRRKHEWQGQMFLAVADLPATAGHPFYLKTIRRPGSPG